MRRVAFYKWTRVLRFLQPPLFLSAETLFGLDFACFCMIITRGCSAAATKCLFLITDKKGRMRRRWKNSWSRVLIRSVGFTCATILLPVAFYLFYIVVSRCACAWKRVNDEDEKQCAPCEIDFNLQMREKLAEPCKVRNTRTHTLSLRNGRIMWWWYICHHCLRGSFIARFYFQLLICWNFRLWNLGLQFIWLAHWVFLDLEEFWWQTSHLNSLSFLHNQ